MPPPSKPHFLRRLWMGRIARAHYFLGSALGIGISFAILFVLVFLWGIINIINEVTGGTSSFSIIFNIFDVVIPILIALALVVPIYFIHAVLAIRRYHDMGWSGWCYLLLWIPFVNIIFALILLFKRGTPEVNAYGLPPGEERGFLSDVFNY